ncbi:helix-turn-helix domain-containing protein [Algoriphagus halophilus]|uniref:hypothetical protein n=1 Tax=Algoriphagus halophilus TaxID=226505 RepID=UPI00135636D4|nr:hypothetical protein [Algoriphagus halophilus]
MGSFLDQQVQDFYGNSFLLLNLLTQKDLGDLTGLTRQTVASASRTLSKAK